MAAFYDRMRTTVDHWFAHWKERIEYADLSPAERARLAQDLGIGDTALRRIVMTPANGEGALTELLAAIGMDEAKMEREIPSVLRDIWVVCAQCGEGRRCHRAIAAGTAPETFGSFCPNRQTLAELRPAFSRKPS